MHNGFSAGLVSVSFRRHSPREILEAMKMAGLSCVEWGSDVHAPCRDSERLEELAELQREMGIICSSYGTYFRLGEAPVEELEAYAAAAKRLGTSVLRLWCGSKSGATLAREARQALVADCLRAAELAEKQGVTLCMECHKGTFTEDPKDAVWLMEEIDSPRFRMYWQPFQWQDAEQNLRNAEMIAPYCKNIHVFHWKGAQKLPLAEAAEEWRSYLQCFSGTQTLLLEFMPGDKIEELAAEAEALRKIIGELK